MSVHSTTSMAYSHSLFITLRNIKILKHMMKNVILSVLISHTQEFYIILFNIKWYKRSFI